MFPLVVHFRETASHARLVVLAKYVTARDFLSLLGRLVSISDLAPLGRLRYRPLQLYLLAYWCPSLGQLMDRIPFLGDYLAHKRVRVVDNSEGSLPLSPSNQGKVVMFHSDNSSATAYLWNQADTHSLPMFRLGSSSEFSVTSLGQVVSLCLSPNCTNATTVSQVGALNPVSNAAGCSPSALPTVSSNAAQVSSRLFSRETSITMTPGAASVRGIP